MVGIVEVGAVGISYNGVRSSPARRVVGRSPGVCVPGRAVSTVRVHGTIGSRGASLVYDLLPSTAGLPAPTLVLFGGTFAGRIAPAAVGVWLPCVTAGIGRMWTWVAGKLI